MSHKAQARRSHDDDSDVEQELHDKKYRNNNGGSNGYSKGKPSNNRKGSDDDSDSDDGYQSKSKAGQKADKKYDSKNRRSDDSGSGEEEKANGRSETYEVIIKGLPFASSDQDVNDFFQDCGEIERVNLLKGPDGRSKGIAFVKFYDEKSLRKAVELNGSDLGGRTVTIEKTVPKEQRGSGDRGDRGDRQRSERDPNSTTVFVGNLSYGTDEGSLRDIFESCGKIKEVRIASDQDGKPRGFGYVEFASGDSVDKAIQKTGSKVDGRAIRVDFTNSRKNDGGGNRGFGGGRGGRGGYGGGNRRGGNRY